MLPRYCDKPDRPAWRSSPGTCSALAVPRLRLREVAAGAARQGRHACTHAAGTEDVTLRLQETASSAENTAADPQKGSPEALSKIAGYKVDAQNPLVFLCTSNEQPEF